MKERRSRRTRSGGTPWFLLTGFVIGLALGLVYGYLVNPVEYVDSSPSVLNGQDKDRYRAMIAQAYLADTNLERARQRLALLKDNAGSQNLAAQAQRLLGANANDLDAHALAILAAALAPQRSPTPQIINTPALSTTPQLEVTVPVISPSSTLSPGQAVQTATLLPSLTPTITPTVTLTPAVTFTPRYTDRPTATLGSPFSLKDKKQVCDATITNDLLQVNVVNGAGQGIPGVVIHVTWPGGEDAFYTGLTPDHGPGYADFLMTPRVTYSVRAGEGGEVASGLSAPSCGSGDSVFFGGWSLQFGQ